MLWLWRAGNGRIARTEDGTEEMSREARERERERPSLCLESLSLSPSRKPNLNIPFA